MSTKTYSQEVRDVADSVKAKMKLGDNGIVTMDKDAFEATLEGTELSLKDFKACQNHRDLFVAGQGLALGEIGLAAMKKDKKLPQVSVETKIHKDKVSAAFTRSKMVSDGKGGQQEKFGSLASRVVANGAGNRGQHKLVRVHLSDLAKEAMG